MEPLLTDRPNVDEAIQKRQAINDAFNRFQRAHCEYYSCLYETHEDQLEAQRLYDKQSQRKHEVLTKVNALMEQNAQDEDLEVQPDESVSRIGSQACTRSRAGSILSSASSSEIQRVRVKQAVARLRLKQLKQKQELIRQEEEVRMKREEFVAQSEIEQADLEAKVYEDDISPEERIGYEDRKPLRLNPDAPSWPSPRQTESAQIRRDNPNPRGDHAPHTQQALETLAQTIRQGFALPKPELSKFDGSPLEYWSFIRSFDNNIERNASDESEKLTFLMQYCTGDSKKVIKSCVTMEPSGGYQAAR